MEGDVQKVHGRRREEGGGNRLVCQSNQQKFSKLGGRKEGGGRREGGRNREEGGRREGRKMGPWKLLGSSWVLLEGALEALWELLGAPWCSLGASG